MLRLRSPNLSALRIVLAKAPCREAAITPATLKTGRNAAGTRNLAGDGVWGLRPQKIDLYFKLFADSNESQQDRLRGLARYARASRQIVARQRRSRFPRDADLVPITGDLLLRGDVEQFLDG